MFNAAFDGEKKFNQFLMHSLTPLTSVRLLIIHSITSFSGYNIHGIRKKKTLLANQSLYFLFL